MNPGHNPGHNPCHRNPLRFRPFRLFSALLAGFSAFFRRGTPLSLPTRPALGMRVGKTPPGPEREFRCNPCHVPEIFHKSLHLYPLPWPGFLADISALLPENPGHRAIIPATRPPGDPGRNSTIPDTEPPFPRAPEGT